jgi:hypothetical protein
MEEAHLGKHIVASDLLLDTVVNLDQFEEKRVQSTIEMAIERVTITI